MRYARKLYHSLRKGWQRKKRQRIKPLPYSIVPPVELYDSIKTLVINNWEEIRETGNISLLLKEKVQNPSFKLLRYCLDVWNEIRDEEIRRFDTLNKEYFRATAKVATLKINHAISQSPMDFLRLELAEGELAGLAQLEKPPTVTETKFILQGSGIDINTRTDTVEDYYTAINTHMKNVSNGKR